MMNFPQQMRPKRNQRNYYIIIADVILLFLLIKFLPYDPNVNKGLAILFFVAVLWISEALHVAITALSIPLLAIALGLSDVKPALSTFADPTIYLFLGGFVLAGALHVQKLDVLIAHKIIFLAKNKLHYAIFYLFMVTALLSMWISNTATVAMMLPLVLGVLGQLDRVVHHRTYVFVLLGVAYSASIGGMGTIVGSPPNAIVASQLDVNFFQWMQYGVPIVILLLPIMILVLYFVFKPHIKQTFQFEYKPTKLSLDQIITLGIFIFTALCWIFSSYLNPLVAGWSGYGESFSNFDSFIALLAVILICVSQVSHWKELQKHVDWGILILFGGGLTLSVILRDSGASVVLSDLLTSSIENSHFFIIGLVISLFVVFLTEFMSNTSCAALLVPIFISVSAELGVDPLALSLIIGFGASCAFMLPVATPPNALVFGTGEITQREMIRAGFVLNICCALILGTVAYYFWF